MTQTMNDFNIGDGVSTHLNGDYYPFTVIAKKGKRLTIQADRSVCTKPATSWGADDAEYRFERDPNGRTEVWSLRKNGRFKRAEDSINSWWGLVPGRRDRRNPDV